MDKPPHGETRPPIPGPGSLKAAIRKARIESAERSDVVADLRGAELARLELLQDAISGVLAEVPEGIDMFDPGLVPGEHPRLFIDMLAFVEMGRDRRTYRFLQDTRYGRIVILENDQLGALVEAVTTYVARRLVEREKALASDMTLPPAPVAAAPAPPPPPAPVPAPAAEAAPGPAKTAAEPRQPPARITRPEVRRSRPWPPEPSPANSLMRGLVNTLALVVLIMLVGAAVYFAAQEWTRPT